MAEQIHAGKSNPKGGVALGITSATFATHVQNIMRKHGLVSRAQIASLVERRRSQGGLNLR